MRRFLSLLLIATALISSLPAHAAVYDAQADFQVIVSEPISPNPNGVWSYNYAASLSSPVIALPNKVAYYGGAVVGYGVATLPDQAPVFYKGIQDTAGLNAGEVGLHGGVNGELAILRFTAPGAGHYSIEAAWGAGNSGNVDIYLQHNRVNLIPPVMSTFTSGSAPTFNQFLATGDTIDLMVGTAGDYHSDTTPVNLVITGQAVPEPASMAIWGAVLAGAFGLKRWRRRA